MSLGAQLGRAEVFSVLGGGFFDIVLIPLREITKAKATSAA